MPCLISFIRELLHETRVALLCLAILGFVGCATSPSNLNGEASEDAKLVPGDIIIVPGSHDLPEVEQGRFYYITGEVNARGRYHLVGHLTVFKALMAAGGANESSNMKKVIVHRGTKRFRVNCIKAASDPRYDVEVKSGDIIEVPKKGILPFL